MFYTATDDRRYVRRASGVESEAAESAAFPLGARVGEVEGMSYKDKTSVHQGTGSIL